MASSSDASCVKNDSQSTSLVSIMANLTSIVPRVAEPRRPPWLWICAQPPWSRRGPLSGRRESPPAPVGDPSPGPDGAENTDAVSRGGDGVSNLMGVLGQLAWILRSCLSASSRALLVVSSWSSVSFSSPSSFFLPVDTWARCFFSSSSSDSSSRTWQRSREFFVPQF